MDIARTRLSWRHLKAKVHTANNEKEPTVSEVSAFLSLTESFSMGLPRRLVT